MIGTSHPLHTYTNPLHTYKRCLTYSICGGQSYECVLTPPIAMAKFGVWQWQDQKSGW